MRCNKIWWFVVIGLSVSGALVGCGSTSTPAPVFERSPAKKETAPVESRTDGTRSSRSNSSAGASASTASANSATGSNTQSTKQKTGADQAKSSSSKKEDSGTKPAAKSSAKPTSGSTAQRTPQEAAKPYRAGDWRPEYYTVRKGDTLYSIALDYGQDYRDLAQWNALSNASYIQIGQQLRLFPAGGIAKTFTPEPVVLPPAALPTVGKPLSGTKQILTFSEPMAHRALYTEKSYADLQRQIGGETKTTVAKVKTVPAAKPEKTWKPPSKTAPEPVQAGRAGLPDERLSWEWPAPGKVLYGFSSGPNKKGVAIQGKPGQAVVSSAPGKVVYSGSGLRGYGQLIIIKHNETYLSVYAHNSQLLVKEGQMVAQGQKIAVMGGAKPGTTALHFEIRRLGKPIDPLSQLPSRPS